MEDAYLVVKSIDLLTRKEAKQLPKNIRATNEWWWLQNIGHNNDPEYVVCVGPFGDIDGIGACILDSVCDIRPALTIEDLDKLNLPLYTELKVFGENWIYIGNNKALCKEWLWEGEFDERINKYKTSKVKQDLDDWLIKKKQEFNED